MGSLNECTKLRVWNVRTKKAVSVELMASWSVIKIQLSTKER